MFSLRRIGKSTEVLAFCARAPKSNPKHILIEINAEGFTSETRLLLEILKKLSQGQIWTRIHSAIFSDNAIAQGARDALEKFVGVSADIQAYFPQIMNAIESAMTSTDDIILVIDEFSWLCRHILDSDQKNGRARCDVLLAALRRWRGKGVKMALLGSVGLATLMRKHKIDRNHLNDIPLFEIPPLTRIEAEDMIQALVVGAQINGWTKDHTDQMLEECYAYYPVTIQQAFTQLTIGQKAIPFDRIANRFADRIRPGQDATFFVQFDQRQQLYRDLDGHLPKLLPNLIAAIMKSAKKMLPMSELQTLHDGDPTDLGDALAMLREDGFLSLRAPKEGPQEWSPASGLVTAWWKQRYG